MRVVFDTTVIVSAFRTTHGAAAQLLVRMMDGDLEVAVTTALALEYEAVALRPEHLVAGGLALEQGRLLLDGLLSHMIPVIPGLKLRPISSDPNDDMVIEAAVNARADALVTSNVKDLGPSAATWGVRIVAPAVLLLELEKHS